MPEICMTSNKAKQQQTLPDVMQQQGITSTDSSKLFM